MRRRGPQGDRRRSRRGPARGRTVGGLERLARVVGVHAHDARGFYSHPWAWNEIGFGGPAYPQGYMRLGPIEHAGARTSARARPTRTRSRAEDRGAPHDATCSRVPAGRPTTIRATCSTSTAAICPARRRCAAIREREVDLLIVGAGAGGSVLAQRLARRGWRIVILDAGRSGTRIEDWVSDEAGSHRLYWNQKRIIDGRTRSSSARTTRARCRRLDGPLRRLHAALSPLGLRDLQPATGSAPTGRSPMRS